MRSRPTRSVLVCSYLKSKSEHEVVQQKYLMICSWHRPSQCTQTRNMGGCCPLGQGGRSCRRLSRLPSSPPPPLLLVPSSPSWTPVVPFLLPMWTVCASECFESDHFQAGRREQTPSEEVIYPTKREACQLLASPLDPFCPPWSGLLVATPLLTLHCVSWGGVGH